MVGRQHGQMHSDTHVSIGIVVVAVPSPPPFSSLPLPFSIVFVTVVPVLDDVVPYLKDPSHLFESPTVVVEDPFVPVRRVQPNRNLTLHDRPTEDRVRRLR